MSSPHILSPAKHFSCLIFINGRHTFVDADAVKISAVIFLGITNWIGCTYN